MEKYSKKRLAVGLICLLSGLIIFLYGSMVVAPSACYSCPGGSIQLAIVLTISGILILIGMIISITEFERYIYGPR